MKFRMPGVGILQRKMCWLAPDHGLVADFSA
jgi:hypothetical protein